MKKKSYIKKITGDFILNFLATAAVTGVMQIVMYPLISRLLGNVAYGRFLTIIGIVNTASAVVGSTLNNVRLVHESDYQNDGIKGDFNLFMILFSGLIFGMMLLIFAIAFHMSPVQTFLTCILIVLMAFRNYWSVTYRLSINYFHILLSNICLIIGYFIGCFVIGILAEWQIPFIIGEILCILYISKTSRIISEPYKFTKLKKLVFKDFCIFALTTLSANLLVYLDRLLLYPLIGGESVTIYTVAALGGKYLGMIVTPMASVLLSYYSQKDFQMTRKKFWFISLLCIAGAMVSLLVINPIAPVIIKILYPEAYVLSLEIIPYANLAGVLVVVSNFIQPAILKFAPSKWQIIKEGLYGGIYIGLGILLLKYHGLIGFCIANIVAISVKIVLMLTVGHVYSVSVHANKNELS